MPAASPVILTVLYILAALLVGALGQRRKWGFWGYFWASLVMSPLIGLLFVLAGEKPRRPEAAPAPKAGAGNAAHAPGAAGKSSH